MIRFFMRRMGVLAYAAVLVGGGVALTWKPSPLPAQTAPKCYLVVCSGNVCVWEEIACPKPVAPT